MAMQYEKIYTPDLIASVQSLIAKGISGQEPLGCWEQIKLLFKKNSIGSVYNMPSDQCGVHHKNRGKYGVGGSESIHHGDEILQMGWSWEKCADAAAFACPPPPFDADDQQSNLQLQLLSQGLIPPLTQLKLLSIGSSHTNTFLRQVNAGVRCSVARIAENGHLNKEHLSVGRPGFAEALDTGLKWFVMHWQAPYVWPELPTLVQGALNTVAKGEIGEVECMMRLAELMHEQLGSGVDKQEIDWASIEKTVCSTLPSCRTYVKTLSSFVKEYGGCNAAMIVELGNFVKAKSCSSVGSDRVLGSEFWAALVALKFPLKKIP